MFVFYNYDLKLAYKKEHKVIFVLQKSTIKILFYEILKIEFNCN